MSSIAAHILADARRTLDSFCADHENLARIDQAAALIGSALASRKTVLSCGNGGSMCDAMHFAEELSGRFRKDRPPLPALAISDPGYLSCVANDFGYEHVFSRCVQAFGAPGGVLLAISTSGSSANVLHAAKAAREIGMSVIGLCGKKASPLAEFADVAICAPSPDGYADRTQEVHIKVIHCLIELVERQMFPDLYGAR